MAGALEGLKVVDLSRVLAGPVCTMMLGDLGADVIKVERPGSGDETRAWGPPYAETESAYYLCANRNKRSICSVSYTHLRAHETVLDLVCRLLLEKKKKKK